VADAAWYFGCSLRPLQVRRAEGANLDLRLLEQLAGLLHGVFLALAGIGVGREPYVGHVLIRFSADALRLPNGLLGLRLRVDLGLSLDRRGLLPSVRNPLFGGVLGILQNAGHAIGGLFSSPDDLRGCLAATGVGTLHGPARHVADVRAGGLGLCLDRSLYH
jgi:hypothetical protein